MFVVGVKVVTQGTIIGTINGIQASVKNATSKGLGRVALNERVNLDLFTQRKVSIRQRIIFDKVLEKQFI